MKKLVLYSLLSCFSATLLGCNSNANDDTIDIVETEQEVSTGITKDLSRDLMYSLNGELRTTSAVMQSFDIISNGSLFYSRKSIIGRYK